jgi:hypothetical protein
MMMMIEERQRVHEAAFGLFHFHQLQIENKQYIAKIEERNDELLSIKVAASKTTQILNEFKSISHPLFLKVAENCFQINTLGNIRDTLLPPLISGQLGLSDLDEINNKIKVNA